MPSPARWLPGACLRREHQGSSTQLKDCFWKTVGRGLAPAALGCSRRGGLQTRPPSNRRTPPQFPIYVSKRPTKGRISPYLSRPKAFPPQGADSPCQGEMSRRDGGDRDRCPSAHTGADEGAFRPQMHVPAPLSQPSADSSPVKGRAMVPLQSI